MLSFDQKCEKSIFTGEKEQVLRDLLTGYGISVYGVTLQMAVQVSQFFNESNPKNG
jgi:hypothetical protein